VRLLFDLACISFRKAVAAANSTQKSEIQQHQNKQAKHREKELQMQTLYVIGSLTERKTPPSYFNFDGFDGTIFINYLTLYLLLFMIRIF
jgi:hypothetical protein